VSVGKDMWSDLTASGPKPTRESLGPHLWAWLGSLPADYREFLLKHNGGRAAIGRFGFTVNIPYCGDREKRPSIETYVGEFLPIRARAQRHSMRDLVECNAYVHQSGSIPPDAIVIADCDASLVCLSLRPREFGAVYYWEYYADYPWHQDFFRERRREVFKQFKDGEAILDDPSHFEYMTVLRELQWAMLVRIADSFGDWAGQLTNRSNK
jgi:hypothetical protein